MNQITIKILCEKTIWFLLQTIKFCYIFYAQEKIVSALPYRLSSECAIVFMYWARPIKAFFGVHLPIWQDLSQRLGKWRLFCYHKHSFHFGLQVEKSAKCQIYHLSFISFSVLTTHKMYDSPKKPHIHSHIFSFKCFAFV